MKGTSGSMGKAGDAPAPSLTPFGSLFDLSWPSRNLRGMPRAACLMRAKPIEGIFHNEVICAEEASAPDTTNALPSGRKQLSGHYPPLLLIASELTYHLPTFICLFGVCVWYVQVCVVCTGVCGMCRCVCGVCSACRCVCKCTRLFRCCCSELLFTQSGAMAHGMVSHALRMGCPTSIHSI